MAYQIIAGPMIRTISDYMVDESYGIPNNNPKVYLYSGKGNNIVSLLYAYRLVPAVYKPHFPEPSSGFIIELLSDNRTSYVKVKFINLT